jgi:UDP-glucose 4-epimerase
MSTVLVTGARGFIGKHVCRALADSHEIIGLVRRAPSVPDEGIHWVVQDLSKPLDRGGLPERVDAIIHLAQSRYHREFPDQAQDIYDVNVGGTFRALEYARAVGVESFILAASGGVYRVSPRGIREGDAADPLTFYLRSKYIGELLASSYKEYFRTVFLRFFFVYGPGQRDVMLIPRLVNMIRQGDTITVEGDPGLRINPIHVDDAVRVFEPLLTGQDCGLFNVAGNEVVSIGELVQMIGETVGRNAVVQHTPTDLGGDLVADITRMKTILGVDPAIPLREGLHEIAQVQEKRG